MMWEQNVIDVEAGKELAKGEIVIVAYDYKQEKTIPIPQEWRDKITAFEGLKILT
jgi:acyl-CoA thioester hydrolase